MNAPLIGPITLVLGASERPDRYANMAVRRLRAHGHAVVAVGLRAGLIGDVPIDTALPSVPVDTVTLYVGPVNLEQWREALLKLQPRRIIFNPGTEHPPFEADASAQGIAVEVGCTLVMLAAGTY
ncbi:MAG: CoA-binding protein [Flavobacteriales bacterium]